MPASACAPYPCNPYTGDIIQNPICRENILEAVRRFKSVYGNKN
jgi:hypothetical protein